MIVVLTLVDEIKRHCMLLQIILSFEWKIFAEFTGILVENVGCTGLLLLTEAAMAVSLLKQPMNRKMYSHNINEEY